MTVPVAFAERKIRRILFADEWWFAVEDVCGVLMDSPDGVKCWRQLQQSLAEEGCEVGTLCHALEMPAPHGATRRTDCVTLEGIFRVVQSIASPKAEVVKRWLAQAGRSEKRPQRYRTDVDSIFALLEEAVGAKMISAIREDKMAGMPSGRQR